MTTSTADAVRERAGGGPEPALDGRGRGVPERILVGAFVTLPARALVVAVPRSPRRAHGADRHAARLIWALEKLGWARDVRWPTPARLRRLEARPGTPT